ncbi:MAG: UDP-N-acetylmuramyl peptide synthase [Methanobrevibacter sp.]|jgi:UDP-N-acetylmuramate--alanine ligase/UDP-N-acetylmuramoyl-L-alanyl-D-glutamate--2,6-diaminopimelate ligase|nr:UDP-N-acetylmuramyl peptide synthase [Methanobrevibacter sp.]
MKLTINSITKSISGRVIRSNTKNNNQEFSGLFTVLDSAKKGDIVIRHWINGKGIKIANEKDVLAIITENPLENSIELAESLDFPIIIVDKIENANAFALNYSLNLFASNSKKVVVSGTNGKSTTSHLIYHILNNLGANVVTNTDFKSEFNTLIDPMVSKLISDYGIEKELDYVIIEVSEIQGWVNRLMKNHAPIMTTAINPDVTVITNISLDHIDLIDSLEEIYKEISKIIRVIRKGTIVLNKGDQLVSSLNEFKNSDVKSFYFLYNDNHINNEKDKIVSFDNKNIIYNDEIILSLDEIPFKSKHFIENILAAISVCINLNIPLSNIIEGVMSYKPLKRRFSKLNENPLIIDDFAHNPEGIRATINAVSKINNGTLWIVSAIRGSRGIEINGLNSKSLVDSIYSCKDIKVNLIISNSSDFVDGVNIVKLNEERIFLKVLNDNKIDFTHFDKLHDALSYTYNNANIKDTILFIGAQGMDFAETVLEDIKKC